MKLIVYRTQLKIEGNSFSSWPCRRVVSYLVSSNVLNVSCRSISYPTVLKPIWHNRVLSDIASSHIISFLPLAHPIIYSSSMKHCSKYTLSNASSLVWGVLMTSKSFISCTGLKKWRPTNLSGRPDARAIPVTGREDVFDAKMHSGLINGPRFCVALMANMWREKMTESRAETKG